LYDLYDSVTKSCMICMIRVYRRGITAGISIGCHISKSEKCKNDTIQKMGLSSQPCMRLQMIDLAMVERSFGVLILCYRIPVPNLVISLFVVIFIYQCAKEHSWYCWHQSPRIILFLLSIPCLNSGTPNIIFILFW
jgi:phage terminase large subunit-like protein